MISWVALAGPPPVRPITRSNTFTVNTNPRSRVTSMTGRMIGTITRRSRCQGLAPSMIAASLTSTGTSWSAL